jgi:hypothetical protein
VNLFLKKRNSVLTEGGSVDDEEQIEKGSARDFALQEGI